LGIDIRLKMKEEARLKKKVERENRK